MKKVALHTLGCKLNYAEGETLLSLCEKQGYEATEFGEAADLILINTCSVTEQADQKCRAAISKARRSASKATIVITGCYAQLRPSQIAELEGVDHVVGTKEKFDFLANLPSSLQGPQLCVSPIAEAEVFRPAVSFRTRTRAILKVQDGCDYGCSFCTIPLARGKSRSGSLDSLEAQVRQLNKEGVQEITLSGVNVGDFATKKSHKKEHPLLSLMKRLDLLGSPPRFRISSIEPNLLSSDVIRFIAENPRWMPHFHIPLQSGSDRILGQMRRRYKTKLYADRVAEIKAQIPKACIGADVIVGFPGETADDFDHTYQFLLKLDLQYLHVFPYAARPATVAAEMGSQIAPQLRKERAAQLRQLSLRKQLSFYRSQIGSTHELLLEQETKEGFQFGYTPNYLRVGIPRHEGLSAGQIHQVYIQKLHPQGFLEADSMSLISDPLPTSSSER